MLNDAKEYKSGFDIIEDILKERGLSENKTLREMRTENLNRDFYIFIGCFSNHGDSLSQWRAYAEDGKGVSIGFDKNELVQFNLFNRFLENKLNPISSKVRLLDVNYEEDDFKAQVNSLIDEIEARNPRLKDKMLARAFCILSASYKNSFFSDEKETRAAIIIENNADPKYKLDVRNTLYGKANFHKLNTSFDKLSTIKKVIIGPKSDLKFEQVEEKLRSNGLESVNIIFSTGKEIYR